MSILSRLVTDSRNWIESCFRGWDQFWFTPRLPHTVCLLRILTGAMLLYAHLVLATELTSFLGENAWINNDTARQLHDGTFVQADMARSYLWDIDSPALIRGHHALTILVTFAFMVGFLTRITGPAAWFLQLMYVHRLTGALFGLDQIVTYSAMYLMLAPCGSVFSVDAWLRTRFREKVEGSKRLSWLFPEAVPSVAANISTRLLQLHLCVIYVFGGLAKARGSSWWDGSAVWYAVSNYEYQSIDMTWLAGYPKLFSALSNITLFWEIFYCALIWPKRTRFLMLAIAFAVHGGIALFLGMATFGLMMLAANLIFIEPQWLLRFLPGGSTYAKELGQADSTSAIRSTISEQELVQRKAKLKQVAKKLKAKNARLKERHEKVRRREHRYRARVERLKSREAKIKAFSEKRRRAKEARRAKETEAPTDE